jgi:uncharacterized membrane protein YbaN (DUF454 family)
MNNNYNPLPQMQVPAKKLSLPVRILLMITGVFSLAIGIIGIAIPVLPTTPFLILSAAAFLRSNNRLYAWLFTNKIVIVKPAVTPSRA